MAKDYAPLPGTMMILSMIGFIFVILYTNKGLIPNKTWGFTLALICVIIFVACLISMTYGPEEVMIKKDKIRWI